MISQICVYWTNLLLSPLMRTIRTMSAFHLKLTCCATQCEDSMDLLMDRLYVPFVNFDGTLPSAGKLEPLQQTFTHTE